MRHRLPLTPELDGKLEEAYRQTITIAGAMVVSVLLYAGVVAILNRLAPLTSPPADAGTVETLRQVFRGLALVHFLAVAWLAGRPRQLEGPKPQRIQRLKAKTLMCLALAEPIAIYGLILFFLSRGPVDFYFFFLASLLSFGLAFPRRDRWRPASS